MRMNKDKMPRKKTQGTRGGNFWPAFCNFVGILIILAVIVTAVPLALPRYLGYEIYNVVTGSMEPEIPTGSVIYVSQIAPEEIKSGDIIAFYSGDGESVVCHRVVENRIVEGEFITKGDANPREDINAVTYGELIGIVVRHFPVVGDLMALYSSTVGKIYVLGFAACGVLFNVLAGRIRSRNREYKRDKIKLQMNSDGE